MTTKKLLSFITCLIILTTAKAQNYYTLENAPKSIKNKYEEGRALLYEGVEKKKGLILLTELATKHPILLDACFELGEYYTLREENLSMAIAHYKKGISLNKKYKPETLYNLSLLEIKAKLYESALIHLNEYLKEPNSYNKNEALSMLQIMNFRMDALQHPVPFDLLNLGPEVNTTAHEYAPFIIGFNEELILTTDKILPSDANGFSSIRSNEELVSLYQIDGRWGNKKNWTEFNTSNNEGGIAVANNGKILVYVECNKKEDKGDCDLVYSEWKEHKWTKPQSMGPMINTDEWESQPTLSADGNTMIFTRNNMSVSYLMSTHRNADGTWKEPVFIKNFKSCRGPFLHPEGNTLYFTSDAYLGMGGYDLFVSYLQPDSSWSVPKNLGYPINTENNEEDISISRDGYTAYIASDRAGGYGGMDIYSFQLHRAVRPNIIYLSGTIKDSTTQKILEAKVFIHEEDKGIYEASTTTKNGEYSFVLLPGKKYEVHVESKGYQPSEALVIKTDSQLYTAYKSNIQLQPIIKEKSILLKNVLFERSKPILLSTSYPELDRLVHWLQSEATVCIKIKGHTDNVGDSEANLKLSEERVLAIKSFLINQGINSNRITGKGYGGLLPIAPNDTEENKQKNRRVEFEVTSR